MKEYKEDKIVSHCFLNITINAFFVRKLSYVLGERLTFLNRFMFYIFLKERFKKVVCQLYLKVKTLV